MPVLPRRPSVFLLPALLLVAAVLPTAAVASPAAVIRDCQDGSMSRTYSAKDYASALREIPTDVDEYTDCRDVIRRAQLGAAGGTGGGGASAGGGASDGGATGGGTGGAGPGSARAPDGRPLSVKDVLASASPEERAAIRDASASVGTEPVVVGGRSIDPADIARGARASSSDLPAPLLGALILLAVGVAAAAAHHLRTRVLGRRPAF